MLEYEAVTQQNYLQEVLRLRQASGPPTPAIAVWPPDALRLREPPADLYFYRPGELLVPQDQTELFESTARSIGLEVSDASDSFVRPRGETYATVRVPRETFPTQTARFIVHTKGEFNPEAACRELEAAAETAGRQLKVTPNHVIFGCPNWLMEPCGDPSKPAHAEAPPTRRGGEGVVVAVVDSGLPAGYDQNPLLAPVKTDQPEELEDFAYQGSAALGTARTLHYAQGHGAFVAGMVRQHAADATVWSFRALDDVGTSDEWALGHQLALAINQVHPRIINLSLGTLTRRDQPSLGLTALGHLADEKGGAPPIVVAAAGNLRQARPFYPAYDHWAISVGAAAEDEGTWAQAYFSDFGDPRFGFWVDVCARGVEVYSSYVAQDYQPKFPPPAGPVHFEGWAHWNGTSFAAPHVSGDIARLLGQPGNAGMHRHAVLDHLKAGAPVVGDIGSLVR
jgi:Subtilase family